MVERKKVKKDPIVETQKKKDSIEETINEIENEVKKLKHADIFICLQDCLKKIQNIKRDHGYKA